MPFDDDAYHQMSASEETMGMTLQYAKANTGSASCHARNSLRNVKYLVPQVEVEGMDG